jgi:hypothetical protein
LWCETRSGAGGGTRSGPPRDSLLAWLVARAKQAFVAGGWGRRVERLTGAVLIGLGIRLAFEAR